MKKFRIAPENSTVGGQIMLPQDPNFLTKFFK